MKLFGSFVWISLIGFCYAKVEDYLKGIQFERSFSPIEGKVIDFHIIMNNEKYSDMVENSQLSMEEFMGQYHGHYPEDLKFSTKVSLNITVDDKVYSYDNVKLKLGGNSSKFYQKVGFNLKLNKEEVFLGRKNLHLRPDYNDLSHLHSKLAIDLVNKWNIPTVQEAFTNVYINGKYFGFYMLLDTINTAWISDIYKLPENEEVQTLYSCEGLKLAFNPEIVRSICQNKKDDYLNYTQPLYDMVDKIYEYTSLEQLEETFDNVSDIRKMFIYEYLFGTPDNFIMGGNNYNFYKKSNGKWDFIPMDFSILYLYDFEDMLTAIPYEVPRKEKLIDYAKVKFDDWHSPGTRKPFIDILYYNNKKEFIETLKELLITGFNPDELFARIDELAEFIAPHIEKDMTPDENGVLPGHINIKGTLVNHTLDNFWNSLRNDDFEDKFGLKKYFQVKFDSVCELYGLNKKQILREAKIYRQKRAVEIFLYDLKQQLYGLLHKIL